jgi:YD repeat-containing protein
MSRKALSLARVILPITQPALAHQSFSMFDNRKTLTIDGTVKQFEVVNPHGWIYVVTTDAAGKPVELGDRDGRTWRTQPQRLARRHGQTRLQDFG